MLISAPPHPSVHASFRRIVENTPHSTDGDVKLRQHHAHCEAESSDIVLYLAGVNGHAVLRGVESKRWSVAHFLRTIQYLFEYGVRLLAT
jgi:hypothetical protein